MAVPCSGCGREYDVTLFQFGRTLHCACGTRVGLEARVRSIRRGEDGRPRFMVDSMLGRLARWLRILGYDTEYEADIADVDLVRRALDEGRILVTRDRLLPEEWRIADVQLLESDHLESQLRELAAECTLAPGPRLFSRCSRCNVEMQATERARVFGLVPERVWRDHEEFRMCPRCHRVYWPGSHTERMQRVVDRALGDDDARA